MKTFLTSSLLAVLAAANPFEGKTLYVNPSYQTELDSSIATAQGLAKENLQKMREMSSAYWIDVKAKLHGQSVRVDGTLRTEWPCAFGQPCSFQQENLNAFASVKSLFAVPALFGKWSQYLSTISLACTSGPSLPLLPTVISD